MVLFVAFLIAVVDFIDIAWMEAMAVKVKPRAVRLYRS